MGQNITTPQGLKESMRHVFSLPSTREDIGLLFLSIGLIFLIPGVITIFVFEPKLIISMIGYDFYFLLFPAIAASLLIVCNGLYLMKKLWRYSHPWLRLLLPAMLYSFSAIAGFVLAIPWNIALLFLWYGLSGVVCVLLLTFIWLKFKRVEVA